MTSGLAPCWRPVSATGSCRATNCASRAWKDGARGRMLQCRRAFMPECRKSSSQGLCGSSSSCTLTHRGRPWCSRRWTCLRASNTAILCTLHRSTGRRDVLLLAQLMGRSGRRKALCPNGHVSKFSWSHGRAGLDLPKSNLLHWRWWRCRRWTTRCGRSPWHRRPRQLNRVTPPVIRRIVCRPFNALGLRSAWCAPARFKHQTARELWTLQKGGWSRWSR